jgi:uncharacterized membrane protein
MSRQLKSQKQKTLELVQLSMLAALVVVLQILSALIPPIGGMVSITLTLIPVVIGAILFGKKGGAILGFTFGVIVMINCITALDPGGNILWNTNPFLTAFLCLLKGTLAGFVPAVVYSAVTSNKTVSTTKKIFSTALAAMLAPIVNTSTFVIGMLLFFKDTLTTWADGKPIMLYILLGLAGLNFLIEFIINIILTPAIIRIVDVVKKKTIH